MMHSFEFMADLGNLFIAGYFVATEVSICYHGLEEFGCNTLF